MIFIHDIFAILKDIRIPDPKNQPKRKNEIKYINLKYAEDAN